MTNRWLGQSDRCMNEVRIANKMIVEGVEGFQTRELERFAIQAPAICGLICLIKAAVRMKTDF